MNTYLAQYIFTPTGAVIDTIVSTKNQREATRKGRAKIANKLDIPLFRANRSLRWKVSMLVNKQGKLDI